MTSGSFAPHAAVAQRVAKLIENIPVVSQTEFQSQTQVCDILLTLPPDYDIRNFFNRYWIKISSLAQACQYCSAKLYLGDDLVAGYGFRLNGEKAAMRTMKYDQFLNRVKGAILIRVPGLTIEQQYNIIKFIHTRIGAAFDCRLVVKSFFRRKFERLFPQPVTAHVANRLSPLRTDAPLTCSTMISIPFFGEGIDFTADPWLVWPIDFILSPKTLKICRF